MKAKLTLLTWWLLLCNAITSSQSGFIVDLLWGVAGFLSGTGTIARVWLAEAAHSLANYFGCLAQQVSPCDFHHFIQFSNISSTFLLRFYPFFCNSIGTNELLWMSTVHISFQTAGSFFIELKWPNDIPALSSICPYDFHLNSLKQLKDVGSVTWR